MMASRPSAAAADGQSALTSPGASRPAWEVARTARPRLLGIGLHRRALRPGTQPVALIVALGEAAELCLPDQAKREASWRRIKKEALAAFRQIGGVPTGDQARALCNTLNIAIPGLDSEAIMLALKEWVAIPNGSACTSQNDTASHVLTAMGLPDEHTKGSLRLSRCHLTPDVPWDDVVRAVEALQ
jgi:cysteine desulfurase